MQAAMILSRRDGSRLAFVVAAVVVGFMASVVACPGDVPGVADVVPPAVLEGWAAGLEAGAGSDAANGAAPASSGLSLATGAPTLSAANGLTMP